MRNGRLVEAVPFNSTTELKLKIMGLDRAQERAIYVTDKPEDTPVSEWVRSMNKAEDYKAVWNIEKNHLACIASKRYEIIQHEQGFHAAVEAIERRGLPVFGQIRNYGDRVDVNILFRDMGVEVNGDKMTMGVKLHNSYNLTRVFGGELFSYRWACSNGMVLGKVVHCRVRQLHMGVFDISRLMYDFIAEATNSSEQFKQYVSIAMADTYEWQLAEKVLEQMLKIKKYRELILEKLSAFKGQRLTRWDVYNAITAVASHGSELTANTYDYLQEKAQEVLAKRLELVEEIQG